MTFGGTEQRNRDRNIRKRQREKVEPKASQSTTRVPLCAIVHITGQERCEPTATSPVQGLEEWLWLGLAYWLLHWLLLAWK